MLDLLLESSKMHSKNEGEKSREFIKYVQINAQT